MNDSEEVVTIHFELDKESLAALLDSVKHRLDTWSDGEKEVEEDLIALKSMLFAALLEFQFDD